VLTKNVIVMLLIVLAEAALDEILHFGPIFRVGVDVLYRIVEFISIYSIGH
jgi:hypothetical protein